MSRFAKLRELLTLAHGLESEARKMRAGSVGRVDRMCEADGYRAKAEYLAGRIDGDEYAARQREALDAKAYPVEG